MVGTMLSIYLCLLLVLNLKPIREVWVGAIKTELSKSLQSRIELEDIEIGLFNRLVVDNFVIYDQNDEVLLSTKKFSVKILWRDLFNKKITLRSVLLMDTNLSLYQQTPDSKLNYEYLLNLLASDSEDTSNEYQLSVGSLIITRAAISYDKRWVEPASEVFSDAHISVTDLNANLSLNALNKDNLKFRIRNLSCKESCGIDIKKLSLNVEGNNDSILVSNFKFTFGNSEIIAQSPILLRQWKQWASDLGVTGRLNINRLCTNDLAKFLPELRNLNTTYNGTINSKTARKETFIDLELKDFEKHFSLNVTSKHFGYQQGDIHLQQFSVDSVILHKLSKCFDQEQQARLPLERFKNLHLDGTMNYDLSSKKGTLNLNVQSLVAGVVNVNSTLANDNLSLNLQTLDTNLSDLLKNDKLPEAITLTANAKATLKDSLLQPEHLSVVVHSATNEELYNLKNITTKVTLNNNRIKCQVASNDENLEFQLHANCRYHNKSFSDFGLTTNINHIDFQKIGIKDTIFNGVWSAKMNLQIPKLTANRSKIALSLDSVIANREHQSFALNKLAALIDYTKDKPSKLNIASDVFSVNAEGTIDHKKLLPLWKSTITQHVSSLSDNKKNDINHKEAVDDVAHTMNFFVNIHQGDFLNKVFLLPLQLSDGATIHGKLNKGQIHSEIAAQTNKFQYENTELDDVSILLTSKALGAGLLVQGKKRMLNNNVQFVVGAQLHDNLLEANVEWDDKTNHDFTGSIHTMTNFFSDQSIVSSVLPTTVLIGDSIWNISRGEIHLIDQKYTVKNLTFNTEHQSLTLNGGLSSVNNDSLHIALRNVNVGYFLDLINFKSVLFDGEATGNAYLSLSPKSPFLSTQLNVKSFLFNHTLFGDALITGNWQSPDERINLSAQFTEEQVGNTNVNGYVSPQENSLDLRITANKTNIAFLRYWVDNIAKNIDGRTTGVCRLYGPFNKLDFSGSLRINAKLDVPVNGVSYGLNDAKVLLSSGLFQLDKSSITAPRGGKGTISAYLRHTNLKQFSYDLDLDANNLLLYDKVRSADMPFYATVYASGKVKLEGNPKQLSLQVDATPTDNSIIVYTENENVATQDANDGFITYRNASKNHSEGYLLSTIPSIHSPLMDMNLHFNINMNSAATLKVLMDEVTGDHLNLRGNGTLIADYYNKGRFQLYGHYDINGGNYQMSIQDVLKKNFEIQPGSSIIFGGDPDEAQLSLKAIYTVPTASLADLNIGENFSDRNIKADCILNIGGIAAAPSVSFDLDLPNINNDEKQMVRKLIATEDDLNMQVIHLLGLGRFYTYDYSLTESYSKQSQSTVAANSFLSSTISSQINEVITSAIGSKNWSFGTNLSTGTSGWTDMEVDGVLSGKLFNDRLHLNGNFGYHENQYNAMRGSNVVGDFDVRYLLNETGNIYLKAYSETNDRYFTKSALTTQGLGIRIQKDFMNLKDLLKFKTKNESNQSTYENTTTPDIINKLD